MFDLPPGHVTWVEGDEELVMVACAGGAGFDTQPGEGARVIAEGAAGLVFESRGRYRLKALEREHELFAAASSVG